MLIAKLVLCFGYNIITFINHTCRHKIPVPSAIGKHCSENNSPRPAPSPILPLYPLDLHQYIASHQVARLPVH